jgi:hypothetical protein
MREIERREVTVTIVTALKIAQTFGRILATLFPDPGKGYGGEQTFVHMRARGSHR